MLSRTPIRSVTEIDKFWSVWRRNSQQFRRIGGARTPTRWNHVSITTSAWRRQRTVLPSGEPPSCRECSKHPYRRAVAWIEYPDMPAAQVERRVELAVRRQSRLEDQAFKLDVVLSEFVFRDQIGGPSVMAGQLRHLAAVAQRPNVSVRMVPFDAPGHLGSIVGSFVLLDFPKNAAFGTTEPPVAFIEEYTGVLFLERDSEVKRYRDAFAEISRVALDQDTTGQLALSLAEEYGR
ncbi:DUF5753 domain-containing protein [Nocardia sp. NPDC003693]